MHEVANPRWVTFVVSMTEETLGETQGIWVSHTVVSSCIHDPGVGKKALLSILWQLA